MRLLVLACLVTVTLSGCAPAAAPLPPTRVTPISRCPSLVTHEDPSDARSAPSGLLLPPGMHVVGALVCRYELRTATAPHPQHRLVESVTLRASEAALLAAAAAEVRVQHASPGPVACPAETGGLVLVALDLTRRSAVDLWWRSSGCQTISDGTAVAHQEGNDSFERFQDAFAKVVGDR